MAARVPIVASKLPSIEEILQDGINSCLVEPNNPKALAEGITYVLENEERARILADRAYQDVQQFTWKKRAQHILDFITSHAS